MVDEGGETVTVENVVPGDIVSLPDVDPKRRATVVGVGRFEGGPPLDQMRVLLFDDAPAVQNWLRVDRLITRWGRSHESDESPTTESSVG